MTLQIQNEINKKYKQYRRNYELDLQSNRPNGFANIADFGLFNNSDIHCYIIQIFVNGKKYAYFFNDNDTSPIGSLQRFKQISKQYYSEYYIEDTFKSLLNVNNYQFLTQTCYSLDSMAQIITSITTNEQAWHIMKIFAQKEQTAKTIREKQNKPLTKLEVLEINSF